MDSLSRAIENTVATIEKLRVRLRPVLRSQPTCEGNDIDKIVDLVPLAGEIRCKARQVDQINESLKLTLSELEL